MRQNIIVYIQMGSSLVKDEQIDISVEVNKGFYMAGEQVEGIIFLNAKSTRQYSNLILRLVGQEKVYWTEQAGDYQISYSNMYYNYDNGFEVFNFQGQVAQGHYSFPFSFILPSAMSGSFVYSEDHYIQYALIALLNHPIEQDHKQIYELKLNIMQPLRRKLGPASSTQTTNAQCCRGCTGCEWCGGCGCCEDYGNIKVSLSSDKNFVMMGDRINVSVVIDNSQGKVEVRHASIYFEERTVMIATGGYFSDDSYRYQVWHVMGKINPGQVENLNFSATIPQWNSYTAIGTITARYFLMKVSTNLGCCANSPSAALHIVVNTDRPIIVKQIKKPLPENWHPDEAPKVINNNMPPFVNQPMAGIRFRNIGQNNVSQNPMGQMGQQPSFQNDSLNEISKKNAHDQQYGKKGSH